MEEIGFLEEQLNKMRRILKAPFSSSSHTDFLMIQSRCSAYLTGQAIHDLFCGDVCLSREQSFYYRGRLAEISLAHVNWALGERG